MSCVCIWILKEYFSWLICHQCSAERGRFFKGCSALSIILIWRFSFRLRVPLIFLNIVKGFIFVIPLPRFPSIASSSIQSLSNPCLEQFLLSHLYCLYYYSFLIYSFQHFRITLLLCTVDFSSSQHFEGFSFLFHSFASI